VGTPAAIAGSKQDPAAVDRGGLVFASKCGGCHGATAKGTNRAPDLVRSVLVLDDEKGLLIAPVIRNGRPDKGMPKQDLNEAQVSDVVAWLHVQTYAADHRNTYAYQNVVTGDAKKGHAYFNGAGGCSACHSATGDLKGLAARYSDPHELQNHWLQPRGIGRSAKNATTVTVTLPPARPSPVRSTASTISTLRCATPRATIVLSTATATRRRSSCTIRSRRTATYSANTPTPTYTMSPHTW